MTDTENLTPAQARVLDLLRDGKTPKQVAKKLRITVNGVYAHQRKIRDKGISMDPIEDEAPEPTTTNGGGIPEQEVATAVKAAASTIEEVRHATETQIGNLTEQMKLIDQREEYIVESIEKLTTERSALTDERDRLASTQNKLREAVVEASGEQVPF